MAEVPIELQKGAKSDWIMQKAPWMDQNRKKTMNMW